MQKKSKKKHFLRLGERNKYKSAKREILYPGKSAVLRRKCSASARGNLSGKTAESEKKIKKGLTRGTHGGNICKLSRERLQRAPGAGKKQAESQKREKFLLTKRNVRARIAKFRLGTRERNTGLCTL